MSRPMSIPSKVMDFSSKIQVVIEEFACDRHNAPVGDPCFHVRMGSRDGWLSAICNRRANNRFDGVPTKKFMKEKR